MTNQKFIEVMNISIPVKHNDMCISILSSDKI